MRFILIVSLFLSASYSFAQCEDSTLIKAWGKWNELQYNNATYRLERHSTDSILPANIRRAVREALLQRCGEKIYSKLKITDLRIVIPLREKQENDDLRVEGLIKKGEVKYYYSFLFVESPKIEYRFNIALDVQGTILTEWRLPKLKENEFTRFISFCEATSIAREDKKTAVKKLNDVSLQYDPKLNYWAWKITIGYKYHENDVHFKSYRLTINVLTGEIIDRWDADVKKYDDPTHKQ